MTKEMKIALWRIILAHRPSEATDHVMERSERMKHYKFSLLAWIDAGGSDPIPQPVRASYRSHWSLRRKIEAELANHYHEEAAQ